MKRDQRTKDNREKIVQQGIELLSEHGYHGTGLKMILDAVHVPKGSFYNYFKSKEQFVAEIIDEFSRSLLERMDKYVAESQDPPVETIRSMYQKAIETIEQQDCSKGCLIGDLSAEIGGQSDICQDALQNANRQWQGRMSVLLEKAQEEGAIRDDIPAQQLAEIFWNHWEGALLRMKMEGNSKGVRATLDLLLDKLFQAP